MVGFYRGIILGRLGAEVVNYLKANPIGYAMFRASYSLNGTDLPEDIIPLSFVTKDKVPLVSKGAAPYMPDLAAEVQDEDQNDKFMLDRGKYYLANGSRTVWLVYTEKQIVEILTPDARFLLSIEGIISGGDVLPGFSLPVRDLFSK
jgi:Uma2 family endonuclease